MLDSAQRCESAAGTDLQVSQCPASIAQDADGNLIFDNCYAAFLALHLTPGSSAYLEVGADLEEMHMLIHPIFHRELGCG